MPRRPVLTIDQRLSNRQLRPHNRRWLEWLRDQYRDAWDEPGVRA